MNTMSSTSQPFFIASSNISLFIISSGIYFNAFPSFFTISKAIFLSIKPYINWPLYKIIVLNISSTSLLFFIASRSITLSNNFSGIFNNTFSTISATFLHFTASKAISLSILFSGTISKTKPSSFTASRIISLSNISSGTRLRAIPFIFTILRAKLLSIFAKSKQSNSSGKLRPLNASKIIFSSINS